MTAGFNIAPPHWHEPSNSKGLGIVEAVQAALAAERRADEREAFISLALAQRRMSWGYRKWALEAEAAGKLDDYRRYAKEARHLWRSAKFYIEHARMRNPL